MGCGLLPLLKGLREGTALLVLVCSGSALLSLSELEVGLGTTWDQKNCPFYLLQGDIQGIFPVRGCSNHHGFLHEELSELKLAELLSSAQKTSAETEPGRDIGFPQEL